MPIARFQMQDGRVARFEVPDGTTPEQAQSLIQDHISNQSVSSSQPNFPLKIGKDAFPDTLREVLKNTDWGTRNIAGAGTALSNLWEGVKQFAGKEDQQQIQANSIIRNEAPVGALAGDIGLTALPFGMAGNSVKAAGAVGAGYGALQPIEGAKTALDIAKGKGINTAIGGGLAMGGQALSNKATSWLADKANKVATKNIGSEPIRNTIKEAQDAGYVIPPGQVNPSFVNKRLESASGKIATQQVASERNQVVTDTLARKAAGLAPDTPITPQTLQAARDVIKQPYVDIAGMGMQQHLDNLDALRSEATAAWREYARQGTRSALNDYKNFSGQAKMLEGQIEGQLKTAGRPDLMQAFKNARVALAKNHDVESALIEGGGTVDARAIGRMFQRGEKMTGDLATIGKFANNFKKVVQPPNVMGTPDAHNLRHMMSLLSGGAGFSMGGVPGAILGSAAVESAPVAARSIMFSKPVQQSLFAPKVVSPTLRMGGGLLGYSPIGGTVLGLDAFGQ